MRTFTIYHIPGHKIGATTHYSRRERDNFRHYRVESYIIDELELPDTPETWQIVGDLEWEYADEFGYRRGEHYAEIRRKQRLVSAEQLAANGRRVGRIGGKAGGYATAAKKRKLTKEIADQIRLEYNTTKTSHIKLSKKYNISKQSIGMIVRNQSYLT